MDTRVVIAKRGVGSKDWEIGYDECSFGYMSFIDAIFKTIIDTIFIYSFRYNIKIVVSRM